MRKRRLFTRLGLLVVFLAACAPTTSTAIPAQPVTVMYTETLPAAASTSDTSLQETAAPTQALAATQLPIATSRGPNLEATDPKTVSMASGGLQFVEFFEFW
jgi:predicted RNA-binding protein with PIN domain